MKGFKKGRGITLNAFVRGIVKALTDSQQAMPDAREAHLKEHMETSEDGVYRPKTFTVEISEGRQISVPTYSLAQTNVIGIHRAKVSCSARIIDLENSEHKGTLSHGDCCAVFHVDASHTGKDCFNLEIEFIQRNHSESEHRLLEALDGMVVETSMSDN